MKTKHRHALAISWIDPQCNTFANNISQGLNGTVYDEIWRNKTKWGDAFF